MAHTIAVITALIMVAIIITEAMGSLEAARQEARSQESEVRSEKQVSH
jgi:type II secretory pathway component PulK